MLANDSRRVDVTSAERAGGPRIMVVNTGSSSVKLGLFAVGPAIRRIAAVTVDQIGPSATPGPAPRRDGSGSAARSDHLQAFRRALHELGADPEADVDAIGHRFVHGGRTYTSPVVISRPVLTALGELVPLAPGHLPQAIAAAETLLDAAPSVPQVACFDTAFHHTLPLVARAVPLPRRLGVERFGFHGLSFEYALAVLRSAGGNEANGRVIVAHLGSGASIAAIRHGRCLETTMGFTPAGGLVMGTRPGDLDPGVLVHLARRGATATELQRLINHEGGLLALSEISSDMQELLGSRDPRAKLAVEVFCRQARKFVGALAAVLDGVDTLVFTGGIGAGSPEIRARICAGLGHLGICLDAGASAAHREIVSRRDSAVTVHVIASDEELMIAEHTNATVLAKRGKHGGGKQ